jgi:hypothetical protein
VRPDHYVFGTATTKEQIDLLLVELSKAMNG